MTGKSCQQELEAAGHIASIVSKKRNAHAPFIFFYFVQEPHLWNTTAYIEGLPTSVNII